MKYLKLVVVPLVLYFVGHMAGPMIGSAFVNELEKDTTLRRDVKVNDLIFPVNLAEMRGDDLPEKIKLVKQVTLPTISGEGSKVIAPGREVKLLNRNEKMLIIETTDGLAKGEVEIASTDIFETIGRAKMDAALASAGGSKTPQPAPAKPAPAKPVPQPMPPVVEKPVVAAVVDPVPETSDPMTPAAVEPEPEPEPAGGGKLTPEQIVEVMKKSVSSGAVKEFKLDQVEAWKATEEEDFGGETFQTGLAAYKAETIFGVKTVQAKALIKDGKVSKWVYAKTGMEIR